MNLLGRLGTVKSRPVILIEVQRDYSASPDGVQASQTTRTDEALVSQKMLTSTASFLLLEGSSHPGAGVSLNVKEMCSWVPIELM